MLPSGFPSFLQTVSRPIHAADRINAQWGRGTLRLAAEGVPATNRDWRMRRGMMSPCYTTRWTDLPLVR